MSNRALRIGDRVVIRPGCVAQLAREWDCEVKPRMVFTITDVDDNGRRFFELRGPEAVFMYHHNWSAGHYAWPSEVRLADGATERADVRFEARAAEIEAMKRARRKAKKGARKS